MEEKTNGNKVAGKNVYIYRGLDRYWKGEALAMRVQL